MTKGLTTRSRPVLCSVAAASHSSELRCVASVKKTLNFKTENEKKNINYPSNFKYVGLNILCK